MDLLRSQFARSDATKRGSVSVSEFKTALQRFGVKGGLDPVVKKFTRAEGVDYESFLKHFQGRQTGGAQPSHSGASSVRDPPQHAVDVATPNTSQLAPSWVNPNTPRESVRFSDSASAKQQPRRAEEHHQQHQQHHQHQQQQQHIERSNPDAHMEHSNPPPPPPPVQRHQDVPSFVQKEVSGGGGAPRTTQSEAKYHLPITPQTTYAGRAGAFDGIDVRRGSSGAIDVHRSDSGSVAALALGEIAGERVDLTGMTHCGRRKRGSPMVRAHDASLPVANVASLHGALLDSVQRSRSETASTRRGRGLSVSAKSPSRSYDVISGRKYVESPTRREDSARPEGKRHVSSSAPTTPRHSQGLRTFGDTERPFAEAREIAQTAKGLRTGNSLLPESHFAVGHNAAPATGSPQWPEGSITQRISASHVSHIPGMSATYQEDADSKVQRKARTRTPSSFGYQPIERDAVLSPQPVRPVRSYSPQAIRNSLKIKVNANDLNLTKAWMQLSRDSNAGGVSSGMTPDKFAEAVRTRYALDVTTADVKELTQKEGRITFNDFNQMCKAPPRSSDLLRKDPEFPMKSNGRRCNESLGPSRSDSRPPFATSNDNVGVAMRRSKSSGPMAPIDTRVHTARCSADHYVTTNMQTFSPVRHRSPTVQNRFDTAAGMPNRRREDSQKRKRCFSPGVTNRESVGGLIAHNRPF